MRETGVIVSKRDKWVQEQLMKNEKCEGCSACTAFGPDSMSIEARNDIDAKTGDIVEIEIAPKQVVGHSFLIFLLPIVAMIGGYFIGMELGGRRGFIGESSGIMGALVMLLISFITIRIYDKFWGYAEKNTAHVIRRSQLTSQNSGSANSLAR